jgi:hypothetical protein
MNVHVLDFHLLELLLLFVRQVWLMQDLLHLHLLVASIGRLDEQLLNSLKIDFLVKILIGNIHLFPNFAEDDVTGVPGGPPRDRPQIRAAQ